mgnify:CR=1 FL=1
MMFYDSLLNELHYLNNIANPKDKEFRIKRAYPHIDNNIKDLVGGCFFASKYCKTFRSFESQYFFVIISALEQGAGSDVLEKALNKYIT